MDGAPQEAYGRVKQPARSVGLMLRLKLRSVAGLVGESEFHVFAG